MAGINVSKDLIWEVIRNNSSFIRFRKNAPKKFSVEKFNPTKLNSPRFNGLINLGNVDVRLSKKNDIVVERRSKVTSQPKKFTISHTIPAKAPRTALKRVARKTRAKKGHSYLVRPAQRRASLLLRSLNQIKKTAAQKTTSAKKE